MGRPGGLNIKNTLTDFDVLSCPESLLSTVAKLSAAQTRAARVCAGDVVILWRNKDIKVAKKAGWRDVSFTRCKVKLFEVV
jgi:hypothetical protein